MSEIKQTKFEKFVENATAIGGKIATQRHLSSIRDGFSTYIPFMVVGAFAIMINSVFIQSDGLIASFLDPSKSEIALQNWAIVEFYLSPIFSFISHATMDFMAMYMVFLIGYFLTGTYGEKQLFGGLISLAAFLVLAPFAAAGDSLTYFGTKGILMGLVVSLIAPTIFVKLSASDKLKVSMPAGVPQAVADSFNKLFPIMFTLLIFGLIQPIWGAIAFASGLADSKSIELTITYILTEGGESLTNKLTLLNNDSLWATLSAQTNNFTDMSNIDDIVKSSLLDKIDVSTTATITGVVAGPITNLTAAAGVGEFIYNDQWYFLFNAINQIIFLPLTNLAMSPVTIFIIMLLIGVFWFFGIHGTSVLNAFIHTFWTTATLANTALVGDLGLQGALDSGLLYDWTGSSMDIVMVGGAGATLPFLISILLFSKSPQQRAISKLALPANTFNINEPVTFGMPLMLNVTYIVPYVLYQPIAALMLYYITVAGWVNPVLNYYPWTTPPILGALIGTLDWRGAVWGAFFFLLAGIVYIPFMLFEAKQQINAGAEQRGVSRDEYLLLIKEDSILEKQGRKVASISSKVEEEIKATEEAIVKNNDKLSKLESKLSEVEEDDKKEKINLKIEKINSKNKELSDKLNDLKKELKSKDKEKDALSKEFEKENLERAELNKAKLQELEEKRKLKEK